MATNLTHFLSSIANPSHAFPSLDVSCFRTSASYFSCILLQGAQSVQGCRLVPLESNTLSPVARTSVLNLFPASTNPSWLPCLYFCRIDRGALSCSGVYERGVQYYRYSLRLPAGGMYVYNRPFEKRQSGRTAVGYFGYLRSETFQLAGEGRSLPASRHVGRDIVGFLSATALPFLWSPTSKTLQGC